MRIGQIPDYKVDIKETEQGIEMVRTVVNERTIWVELHDPCLDGKTLIRDAHGSLITKEN